MRGEEGERAATCNCGACKTALGPRTQCAKAFNMRLIAIIPWLLSATSLLFNWSYPPPALSNPAPPSSLSVSLHADMWLEVDAAGAQAHGTWRSGDGRSGDGGGVGAPRLITCVLHASHL